MQVILALPAYNEAENLRPLIEHARRVFSQANLDAHIIIVNDGSMDNTGPLAEELAKGETEIPITVIHHPQNRGLGRTIITGLNAAMKQSTEPNDVIVCMDADNTHSPDYIPQMIERICEGFDIVIASRYQPGSKEIGVPPFRLFLSRGARLVFKLILGLPGVRDYTCGYRAYRASLIREALEKYGDALIQREGFACTDELLVRLTQFSPRITEIPFTLRYDQKKSPSKLPLFRTIWETLKLLREKG